MAKSLIEFDRAVLGQPNVSVNVNDEIVITGIHQGVAVAQTVPNVLPGVIWFEPQSKNFFALRISDLDILLADRPLLQVFAVAKGVA